MDAPEGMSARSRRSSRIAAWILGSIAALATAWLVFLVPMIALRNGRARSSGAEHTPTAGRKP